MSTWEAHGAADNALLSWSSFDEMVWNEFEESGDHIVPGTESSTKIEWILKDESQKNLNNQSDLSMTKSSNLKWPNSLSSELDSKERCFSELDAQQAVLPSKEKGPQVKVPNVRNKSACLSPMDSGFNGGSMEESKGSKFDSTEYEFEGAEGLCKVESGYQDNDADLMNGSCHFLLSDICATEGDLEFLGEVHDEGRGSNLLDYGWGNARNLEDVDKLFLNNDPLFPQAFEDSPDRMLWESSPPVTGGSPGILYQPIRSQTSHELRPLKGDLKSFETKTEFVPCEIPATSVKMETAPAAGRKEPSLSCHAKLPIVSSSEKSPVPVKGENLGGQPISEKERLWGVKTWGPESVEDDSTCTPKEAEKASRARRHAARRKRLEDKSRKQITERKLAPNSYSYLPSNKSQVPTLQDFQSPSTPNSQSTRSGVCESPNSMQCPQPVPYVHAGFGFPAHHMPIVVPCPSAGPQQLQQPQPVFIGYQSALIDPSKLQHVGSSYETSPQPPIGSSTMTPQEKIEKLRWRQKIQAQLAVEQQQRQLINQQLMLEQKQTHKQQQHQTSPILKSSEEAVSGAVRHVPTQAAEPLVWNEGSVTKEESTIEEGDDSLAATVLQQLINIAAEMDVRTRLCLRDSFHRLARSAMQRRAMGDGRGFSGSNTELHNGTCGPESSSSSDQSSSGRILTVADIVETETNPIDRFIANLLFHKRYPSTMGPVYISPNCCAGMPENTQAVLLHESPWAWQTANAFEVSPAAGPSTVNSNVVILRKPSGTAHVIIDAPACSNTSERLTGTSACISSSFAPDVAPEVGSPVQAKSVSSVQVEGFLLDRIKEVTSNPQLSGYDPINSMIIRHALYNQNESEVGCLSEECMRRKPDERKFPSSDLGSKELLLGDQEVLVSASDSKDNEAEMMEVDIPSRTLPLGDVHSLDAGTGER